MWLPVGQRQFAVHCHTVAETYVILRGTAESIEPGDERHHLEVLDSVHMPVGSPHAVRTVGTEDVLLLWFHDGLETEDASKYYDETDPKLKGAPAVKFIKASSLVPSWDAPGAKEAGTFRSYTSYIGGSAGFLHYNRGAGIVNDKIAAGTLRLTSGNAEVPRAYRSTRYCLVLSGAAAVVDHPHVPVAGPVDVVILPPNAPYALRAVGTEPRHVFWILEEAEPENE
jgi:mannose-6-phosphate isomerase-like protein (cupin superfamily)